MPEPRADLAYTQVAARLSHHTVLLCSDGAAVACDWNQSGQRAFPQPGPGPARTQVAARESHAMLLWGAGAAVACGWN